ncbi:hypothetical protein Tco_0331122 [Tanacetum coccineum]
MSLESLQAQEDLMNRLKAFSKRFNRISFGNRLRFIACLWTRLSEYIILRLGIASRLCDDDDDEDYTIAITPCFTNRGARQNSLIMEDEHLDTIPVTESDEFIKSSVEILVPIPSESKGVHKDIDYVDASPPDVEIVSLEVVEIVDPEVGRIDDDILLTIKDDILREKLLNVNLLIAKIDSLRDNPTPSSEVVIKSTSTFPNLFLEETNTFDNSIPESETFRFNLEEISSGSPTTHSELSLPDYKAFYVDNDHFKERSSGSTTTHVDFSQYDSFIFDLSNDQFPPADRSDFNHEEFADELTHIMPLPELECFKFKIEPDPGDLTSIDLGIRKNVSTTNVNVPLEDDQSSLFAYVVWIFLAFLTYPVVPPYLLSTGNEDTIFDPGISIYHSFMPDVSHRSGTFIINDFPDCEDSQVSTRVSHPQLHFGNPGRCFGTVHLAINHLKNQPRICPVNLICEHLLTLLHLELTVNDIWVECFDNFISLPFEICLCKRGLVHLSTVPFQESRHVSSLGK